MKCKDCCATDADGNCLIGEKPRMLVCGHYGCDLQRRVVERCMGIEKPKTNGDLYRAYSDEQLAELFNQIETEGRAYGPRGKKAWLFWLKQNAD